MSKNELTANEAAAIELFAELETINADIETRYQKRTKLQTKLESLTDDGSTPVDKLAAAQRKAETDIGDTERAIELLEKRKTEKLKPVRALLRDLRNADREQLNAIQKQNKQLGEDLSNSQQIKDAIQLLLAAYEYARMSGFAMFYDFGGYCAELGKDVDSDKIGAFVAAQTPLIEHIPSEAIAQLRRYEHQAPEAPPVVSVSRPLPDEPAPAPAQAEAKPESEFTLKPNPKREQARQTLSESDMRAAFG